MDRKAHEGVAVSGREVDAIEQLFDREAMELRGHLGAAAEDAADAHFFQRHLFAERFEQLGGGEHAADIVVGAQKGESLFDDVLFVGFGLVDLAALEQFDDPARIEIGHEADAAAELREVLDGQAEAARAAGAEHQPVGAGRKSIVGQGGAEGFVIDAEVVNGDAGLRHTGAAAGFENVDGAVGVGFGHPAAYGSAAQPLILEEAEAVEVVIAADFGAGIPIELGGIVEPEGAAGFGIEMPLDHLACPGVEGGTRGLGFGRQAGFDQGVHGFSSLV